MNSKNKIKDSFNKKHQCIFSPFVPTFGVILFHSSTTNILSSCIFHGLLSETAALMIFYRTHIRRLCRPIQTPESMLVHLSLAISGSMTCCKFQCWARWRLKRARADGSMWCSKNWHFLGEFIVPSQTISCPTPPSLMHPHSIVLPPPRFKVATVQAGTYFSSRLLRTIAGTWIHLTID